MSDRSPVPPAQSLRVRKGAVELFVQRRKYPGSTGPVLMLVHGSSLSALPTFDLEVPGHADYSMMLWFAARGYDVWTCDHEAYGQSTLTSSSSDVACGVEDLRVVVGLIREQTGGAPLMLYGLSSGALRAAAFAQAYPELVDRLALDGFVWTGRGSEVLSKRRAAMAGLLEASRRPIDRAFIRSIFERDRPGTSDTAVVEACAVAQLALGDSVPTGTYRDMTERLPLVDPEKIRVPTLVARGEHDGIAASADLLAFFERIPCGDKQYAVIPGLAHVTPLGRYRRRMWRQLDAFFSLCRD